MSTNHIVYNPIVYNLFVIFLHTNSWIDDYLSFFIGNTLGLLWTYFRLTLIHFLTYKLLNRWLLEFFHWARLISSLGPNRYPPEHQYPCGNTNGPGWVGRVIPGQNRVGGSFHDIDWRGPKQHFFSLTLALFHLKHAVKEQQYPKNWKKTQLKSVKTRKHWKDNIRSRTSTDMDKILKIRHDKCGVLINTRTSTKTQHLLSELYENTFNPCQIA